MKVKDILQWAEENDIFDLAEFIKTKYFNPDDDESKIWIAMSHGVKNMPRIEEQSSMICGCIKFNDSMNDFNGKISNEEKAKSVSPCHETRRIFKVGIKGPLNKQQEKEFCQSYIKYGKDFDGLETPYLSEKIKQIVKKFPNNLHIDYLISFIKKRFPVLTSEDIEKLIKSIRKD